MRPVPTYIAHKIHVIVAWLPASANKLWEHNRLPFADYTRDPHELHHRNSPTWQPYLQDWEQVGKEQTFWGL